MTRKLLAVAVLLVVSLSARAQDAGTPQARPFRISSLNTPFAMQGEFKGEYRVYPGWVELKVTQATVLVSNHCPYKGRRVLSTLKLALATSRGARGWRIVKAGQPVFLEQVMRPGDTRSFGEMYFYIPVDDSIDLPRHWLVAEMEEIALDAPEDEPRQGYAFAHSCRDIFGEAVAGCD